MGYTLTDLQKQAFKMLRRGKHAYRLAIVSFFMYNCFTCLNGSTPNSLFGSVAPPLEDYIPLNEVIQEYESLEEIDNYNYNLYDVI